MNFPFSYPSRLFPKAFTQFILLLQTLKVYTVWQAIQTSPSHVHGLCFTESSRCDVSHSQQDTPTLTLNTVCGDILNTFHPNTTTKTKVGWITKDSIYHVYIYDRQSDSTMWQCSFSCRLLFEFRKIPVPVSYEGVSAKKSWKLHVC